MNRAYAYTTAVSLLLGVSMLLAAGSAAAQGLYRWVDDAGQVHYGDRIPPEYAKKRREQLNQSGVVVGVQARQKTSQELADDRRARETALAEERERDKRRRYDRYLLTTYNSVSDILTARDERISIIEGRLRLAQEAVNESETVLSSLASRKARLTADGKKIPDTLADQISAYEQGLVANLRAVRSLQAERRDTGDRYNADMERYAELKAAVQASSRGG